METIIHLDTHVLAWLYAGDTRRLSRNAHRAIEKSETVACSPMAMLELQYLFEVGRLGAGARDVISDLQSRIGLVVAAASLGDAMVNAVSFVWTRDPFDRVIAAHAFTENAPLLTADETILANLDLAQWD